MANTNEAPIWDVIEEFKEKVRTQEQDIKNRREKIQALEEELGKKKAALDEQAHRDHLDTIYLRWDKSWSLWGREFFDAKHGGGIRPVDIRVEDADLGAFGRKRRRCGRTRFGWPQIALEHEMEHRASPQGTAHAYPSPLGLDQFARA